MRARLDVDRIRLIRVVCAVVGAAHFVFGYWMGRTTYYVVGPRELWQVLFLVAGVLCAWVAWRPNADRRVVYAGGLTVVSYVSRAAAIVVEWARGKTSLLTPQSAIAGTAWLLLAFFAFVNFFLITDYLSSNRRRDS